MINFAFCVVPKVRSRASQTTYAIISEAEKLVAEVVGNNSLGRRTAIVGLMGEKRLVFLTCGT